MFIPASGPKGTGEYFRSLNIANALTTYRSDLDITFLLNRDSAGAGHCPYSSILLPDTPTYSRKEVLAAMQSVMPDMVIFDATGRSSQLKNAHQLGAKTLFIAQNKKILSRGLGLKRLRYTDEIWIAQPDYVLPLSTFNRIKAELAGIPVIHVGPVFPMITEKDIREARALIPFLEEPFILFNPGGGGHLVNGIPSGNIFEDLACRLSEKVEIPILLVYGPNYRGQKMECDGVLGISSLEPGIFNVAVNRAKAFVSGGGGALFQAAAYNTFTWAISLSPDQDYRIKVLTSNSRQIKGFTSVEDIVATLADLQVPIAQVPVKTSSELMLDRINRLLNE